MVVSETATRKDALQPYLARLIRVEPLAKDHHLFQFRFEDPRLNEEFSFKPGQFIMLSVLGVGEAPFSISSSPTRKGLIDLCVRRIGRVTAALYRLKEDSLVGIRGPYGNGFPIEKMAGNNLLLISGGLGMAPLRSLLWYAVDNRRFFGHIILMYGSRTPNDLLFRRELESLYGRTDLQTLLIVERVNGNEWKGEIGLITDLFKFVEVDPRCTYAAVCGPPVMYKFVLRELVARSFSKDRILMSLERKMRCGVGKCGHCSIGYKYTCIDGPIFTYWDAMNLPEMV